MRLHIVFDQTGKILAVAQASRNSPVRARPRANETAGERAVEMLLPSEYRHFDVATICQRLQVDVTAKVPDLKLKA
jgi:hypothetical protein